MGLGRWQGMVPVAIALMTLGCGAATAEQESEVVPAAEFEKLLDMDSGNFDESSIDIDNEWWPLRPGTQLIYDGYTAEDGEQTPHRIVFTVTDLTKEINGVRTVVIFDRDFTEDRLLESELAFFAQDKAGNVWHFGQYRETYDEAEFVGGRVWLVGQPSDAKAGIMMPADPRAGSPSYSQGYAPAPFNWTDRARVSQTDASTEVPHGSYEGVLVTEEFNAEEPDAFQLKYYARGVGNVRVGWRGNDQQQEELELVQVVELDAQALAAAREQALALETRAYVYGRTPPAVPRSRPGSR